MASSPLRNQVPRTSDMRFLPLLSLPSSGRAVQRSGVGYLGEALADCYQLPVGVRVRVRLAVSPPLQSSRTTRNTVPRAGGRAR